VHACAGARRADGSQLSRQNRIPNGFVFDETTVGGLSAISYDPGRQLYYVISDDRSEHNPARIYTFELDCQATALVMCSSSPPPWLDPTGRPFEPLSRCLLT
jgi:hypothetical protein